MNIPATAQAFADSLAAYREQILAEFANPAPAPSDNYVETQLRARVAELENLLSSEQSNNANNRQLAVEAAVANALGEARAVSDAQQEVLRNERDAAISERDLARLSLESFRTAVQLALEAVAA